MSKYSVELCKGLVDAWKADVAMWRLGDEMLHELGYEAPRDVGGDVRKKFILFSLPVKAWLREVNVLASEELWNGRPNAAINAMRRHGFLDRHRMEKPDGRTENNARVKATLYRVFARENLELNARRAWNVCK